MRKITIILGLTIMFLFTFLSISYAEMANEGSGSYRSGKVGTFDLLTMEKERVQMNYEETGTVVEAPENSPLFNASFRSLGSLHGVKGKWKATGFIVWTRPNSDMVYATYESEGVLGGPSKAMLNFVGGTGTCNGIEGAMEINGTPGIKPSKKGTYNNVSVGKFNWKIP